MEKVILIDGNNILFRSYYATAYNGNVMKNSKGFPTNALFGLINTLNKIIEEEKPTYIMCAFDKGKTFRHLKYADYKGGRMATPDELKMQFPKSRELVEAMGIKALEIDNYEADDIIGTFAKKCNNNKDFDAVIISSDKDLLQLITDEVEVKLLKQVGNIRMTHQEFVNTYGIEPERMVDLKALMGDSSDNILGVKGIGEKTALNLLQEYKTLDNIYENIENIKGKLKDKLLDGKESAYQSYDLATIYTEVPIDTDFETIRYKGYDSLKFIEILEELEFYSFLKKLDIKKENIKEEVKKEEKQEIKIINDINELNINSDYSIYLELFGYNYHDAQGLGFAIYDGKTNYYIPFDVAVNNKEIFLNDYEKYTYDLKKLIYVLKKNNMEIKSCNYDLMISGYLLNMNIKDDISYIMKNNNVDVMFYEEEFGTNAKLHMIDEKIIEEQACKKARFIYETRDEFKKKLIDEDEMYLFEKIEMPLTRVLADMEFTGINVSKDYLEKMGHEIKEKMESVEKDIYDLAGEHFNILSPKQLGEILFVNMKIPYPKRKKESESFSTSKEILDKISPFSPIVEKVLDYRGLAKLYNNYIEGLISEIKEDGKIHTIFNQTLTRTGRLSSSEPNLQNIPAREEYGKLIRKAFFPEKNSIILSSDYSQIELRVFAAISNAENMIQAFIDGHDIHAKTASDIFGKKIEDVTKNERRQAKAVNFGILYGISSFGLSEDLGIDVNKAKKFIDDYLNNYPRIKEYMKETIESAHNNGYVKTIMNRKRVIDEINNKNYMIRSGGERMALNTPIQGSSADILKKAMVEIYDEFEKRGLKSKMLIQVHDELVFNVLKDEEEIVTNIVKDIMENTYKLSVPLVVDINKGTDWYEAK